MIKPRIYIDTSVIGGCFDEEFKEYSNKLFDEFIAGKKIAVISNITVYELENAPPHVRTRLSDIPENFLEKIEMTQEAEELAEKYLKENPSEVAPYKILKPAVEAIKEVVYNRLKLFNNI